jgi:Sec-independent protein translocase protein TatA
MATMLLELYELFEKKLGKEEAKEAIKLVGKAIETVREEAKAQKPVLKAEIREELRKELATKEDIAVLEQKMESLDQKIEFVRREMRILFYVLLAFMFLLNKGTIEFAFKVLGLLK